MDDDSSNALVGRRTVAKGKEPAPRSHGNAVRRAKVKTAMALAAPPTSPPPALRTVGGLRVSQHIAPQNDRHGAPIILTCGTLRVASCEAEAEADGRG